MVKDTPLQDEGVEILFKLIHHLKTPLSTIRMAVSNIKYLVNEHIEQQDMREEYEDILLDADKSVENIAQTVTVIQSLLTQGKSAERVLELSAIIDELKQLLSNEDLSVLIRYDETFQPLMRWRGFNLASLLVSLIRYFPRANQASLVLSIQPGKQDTIEDVGERFIRFRLAAKSDSDYAVSDAYFEDNLGLLIAKWILGQQDIFLHYNKSAREADIYFDLPIHERE